MMIIKLIIETIITGIITMKLTHEDVVCGRGVDRNAVGERMTYSLKYRHHQYYS